MTKSKLSALTAAFFSVTFLLVGCGDDSGNAAATFVCTQAVCDTYAVQSEPSCVAAVSAAFPAACLPQLQAEDACAAQNGCDLTNCQTESDAADACTGN